jgi:hypothetical protein
MGFIKHKDFLHFYSKKILIISQRYGYHKGKLEKGGWVFQKKLKHTPFVEEKL